MLEKFKIGHYTDAENGTGCTVILSEQGAVGGVSVRGASPATRETDLLSNGKTVQEVNAVVLSGGSAFGLEAACGVMDWLKEKNIGYQTKKFRVPIVVGASLYDLEYKNFAYPGKSAGVEACNNAIIGNFASGDIGAATGATASKLLGAESAIKTQLGVQTFELGKVQIAVVMAVNALGDIVSDGKTIAAARFENGEFVDSVKIMTAGSCELTNSNTTIGCIITNAKLTKEQCNSLADLAHDGLARAISPSHTPYDGDCVFVLASGDVEAPFASLTAIIPTLAQKAIVASVSEGQHMSKPISGMIMKIFKKFF